ncbi:hypothetical protein [Paraburkholderia dilworthii]|uniref:Uncharacterized protein n=1 Tax=Paraburkholderia dilworthii TaxID=948106 RepID=A0ABW9DHL2_9BURK
MTNTTSDNTYLLLRSGEARKVGQRATGVIRYDILTNSEHTKVFMRITGNDGGGYFSREAIDFDKTFDCVASYRDDRSLPSKLFASAFMGKSSNNAGFLAAILRAEHLLDAAPGSDFQHVVSGDWTAWKVDTLKLQGTPLADLAAPTSPTAENPHKTQAKGSKNKKIDAGGTAQ